MDPSDSSTQADPADDERSVRITGFASGGDGVGRLPDGRVVFVDGGIPGERVELLDVRTHKRVLRARAGQIVEAGSDRVEPRCAHFGTCGGCRWQHVRYSAQLDAKRQIVLDALKRIGGISLEEKIEIVPSPDAYAYRARARWIESVEGFGYRVRGSKLPSPVDVCPVLVPTAEAALIARVAARQAQPVASPPEDGVHGSKRRRAKEWVVTAGSEGPALVSRSGAGSSARARREKPESVSIEVGGESLRVSGESFVQGNALLWDSLASAVRAECLVDLAGVATARFVELYAGIGFFTLGLAREFASGLALESDRSALADLAFNLRRADLAGRVEILSGRVETRGDLAARIESGDVLLVDPPRMGLDPAVREAIAAKGPSRVVYVSCDPATLARDLRELGAAGYRIASLRAFDLFPQTPHVESVVRLDRNPSPRIDLDPRE